MIKELQSLALDIKVLDENGDEIDIQHAFDDEDEDLALNIPEAEDETLEMNTVADTLEGFGLSDDEGNEIEDDDLFASDTSFDDETDEDLM